MHGDLQSGTVIDDRTYRPVANALVEVRRAFHPTLRATTDEHGHFAIDVAPARATISVARVRTGLDSYVTDAGTLRIGPDDREVVIRLTSHQWAYGFHPRSLCASFQPGETHDVTRILPGHCGR